MIERNIGLYTGSKVPKTLKNAIQMAVHTGNYLNSSDFIRDAIKEKLLREGFLQSVKVSLHKESGNFE
jgi:Arc/MetJ-type ribon-helix-helix transcriptional regulator